MEKEINISLLFKVIAKQWKLLFAINFVILLIIAAYSFIMPQKFESTATLMPPENKGSGGLSSILSNISGGDGIQIPGMSGSGTKATSFQAILNSRTLKLQVFEDLNLDTIEGFDEMDADSKLLFMDNAVYSDISKNGFITVSSAFSTNYFSDSLEQRKAANLSAAIAKRSLEILNNILIEKSNSTAKKSKEYIQKEINRYRLELDSISRKMEEFQSENNVLSIEDQTAAIVSYAIEINTELEKAKLELNLAKIEYASNSRQIKILERQVKELERQSQEIQTGGEENEFSIPLSEIPNLMRIYADLFRERLVLEKVILYLETQKHQEAIQESKDVPVIKVLDEPNVPIKRSSPKRKNMLILGFFISLTLSIIILVFNAYRKGKMEVVEAP